MDKIEFSYNGVDYTLEYNRKSVKAMEEAGFDFSKFESKIITSSFLLFQYAFFMHHKNMYKDEKLIEDILAHMGNRQELTAELGTMLGNTVNTLIGENKETKNVISWKKIK